MMNLLKLKAKPQKLLKQRANSKRKGLEISMSHPKNKESHQSRHRLKKSF